MLDISQFLGPQNSSAPPNTPGYALSGMQSVLQGAEEERSHRADEGLRQQQLTQQAAYQRGELANAAAKAAAVAKKEHDDKVDALMTRVSNARHAGNKDEEDAATQELARMGFSSLASATPANPGNPLSGPLDIPAASPGLSVKDTLGATMEPAKDAGFGWKPGPLAGMALPEQPKTQEIVLGDDGKAVSDTGGRRNIVLGDDGKVAGDSAQAAVPSEFSLRPAALQEPKASAAPLPVTPNSAPVAAPPPSATPRWQRYGAQVEANFRPKIDGASDAIERHAEEFGLSAAKGALEDHSPEEAEKIGREASAADLARYRRMKVGGDGGGVGGSVVSKQEQARQESLTGDIYKWTGRVSTMQKLPEAYSGVEQGRATLRSLEAGGNGTEDRAALLSLVKTLNGKAPSTQEFKAFLDSTGHLGAFENALSAFSSGVDAGKFNPQLMANLKGIIAESIKVASKKIDNAAVQLDAGIDSMGNATAQEKARLKVIGRRLMFAPGGMGGGPESASDKADNAAEDAAQDLLSK